MKIGVDLDNTIVCCDPLFSRAAIERGLVPKDLPAAKNEVRDYLRKAGRESLWTELQGFVYGQRMSEALAFPGVQEFFALCRQRQIPIKIISHKHQYPAAGPRSNLHLAARSWLEKNRFIGTGGLMPSDVFFEPTRRDKIQRIKVEGCTHFIDDLPEFFLESAFPATVKRLLFDPNGKPPPDLGFPSFTSWADIQRFLFPQ